MAASVGPSRFRAAPRMPRFDGLIGVGAVREPPKAGCTLKEGALRPEGGRPEGGRDIDLAAV